MPQHRIVIVDTTVIAQWHDGRNWWTCSKANRNEESDFAVWCGRVEDGVRKAVALVGNAPIVQTTCMPIQRGNAWYSSTTDQHAKSYNDALRELARNV